jgi:predicted nucleotidyltransferase
VSSGQQSLDEAATALLTESVAGIIAIYRFGSSVTGDFRPDSDIDLAVLADGRLDLTSGSTCRTGCRRRCAARSIWSTFEARAR